jgi:L-2-hydroxyglutarate oxidase LhgO
LINISHNNVGHWDCIIIGAGIIGLSIARELKSQRTESKILILEKERTVGVHASGRNSGVLHSGIYYKAETMKAKVCSTGSRLMSEYCKENSLPIKTIGKLIVPTRQKDDEQIDLLIERARLNGVKAEIFDQKQINEMEPEVKSASGRAIFSPNTMIIDPRSVLNQLQSDLVLQGVCILYSSTVKGFDVDKSIVKTDNRSYKYDLLINSAGQYADKIAHQFGVGKQYSLIPFRGSYYKLCKKSQIKIKHLVYPVPDLNMPFLGIHTVNNMQGDTYFGPNAIPALGRENYKGMQGVRIDEAINVFKNILDQYLKNDTNFRGYAHKEMLHFFKHNFVKSCRNLIPNLKEHDLVNSNKVGIRAQLFNIREKKLEMDFVVKQEGKSIHILNAVSPAFTSAFEMARQIVKQNNIH